MPCVVIEWVLDPVVHHPSWVHTFAIWVVLVDVVTVWNVIAKILDSLARVEQHFGKDCRPGSNHRIIVVRRENQLCISTEQKLGQTERMQRYYGRGVRSIQQSSD
jgi:hypothetical protein